MFLCVTFVSSGRLSKTACNKISSQAQTPVRSSVDIFDEHVDTCVLPFWGQLKQLVKSLQERKKGKCEMLKGTKSFSEKTCSMVDFKVAAISESQSYLGYLCFGEQGPEAPERPSTYWASSYSLKFVLWFNLLKRESRKLWFIQMLVIWEKTKLHNRHNISLKSGVKIQKIFSSKF